jgi:exopolysaccharide production protein ExoZ
MATPLHRLDGSAIQAGEIIVMGEGKRFWDNIQILRLVAAYGIVYIHLGGVFVVLGKSPAFLEILRFGTDLFLLVAGFLSAQTLEASRKSGWDFLRDRAIRIFPLYALATILAFLIENYMMRHHPSSVRELLMSLTFVPYGPYPILYPAWTLEIIAEITVITALFQLVSRRYGVYLSSACVVLLALLGQSTPPTNAAIAFCTDPILIDFPLGVMTYRFVTGRASSRLPPGAALPMALGLLAAGTVAIVLRPFFWPEIPRLIGIGLPAASVLLSCSLLERMGLSKPSRQVNFLAKCAYAIYLTHWFVTIVPEKIVAEGGNSALVIALLLILTPVIVTCVAAVVYVYIESPITKYIYRVISVLRSSAR